MPISIHISGESTGFIKTILLDDKVENFSDLRKQISNEFSINPEDITKLMAYFPQTQSRAWDGIEKHDMSLKEFGPINSFKVIISSTKIIECQKEKYHFFQEQQTREKMCMGYAQEGLKKALSDADRDKSHVIITVGSFMPDAHTQDKDCLRRQQFPLEHLGFDSSELQPHEPVHLIHIDPGFADKKCKILQYHEQKKWKLVDQKNNVSTYAKGEDKITIISESIKDKSEMNAYFSATGVSQSVLGVDIREYIKNAAKEGRGFVTGNFYDKANLPVIKIAPAQPHLKKEIEQDEENSKKSLNL